MYRLTVLYGHPEDPADFDAYYEDTHIPIARKMQGLVGWTIGKCESADPSENAPYYLVVNLLTETAADMERMLKSPEGRATLEDVPNFATGGVCFMFSEDQVMV